ncbi:MAG: amidohydrolase family protein [Alphaproteobacteria bacterium]
MIVDAHHHLWSLARGDYGWMEDNPGVDPIRRDYGPADYDPIRKAHGIDATVLVQAAPTVAETRYLLGLAETTGWIAKVVGWVDFEQPGDRAELERLARHPNFAGVRPMIQDIADLDWMHRADVQWGYDAVRDLDLTFDALGFPPHLDNFLRLFERYPDMRVVVDHCMKPQIRDQAFDGWARGLERIARETSVCCKLSGLFTEAAPGCSGLDVRPYAEHVLSVFGASRVMWGSDWPVLALNGDFTGWRAAAAACVPEADRSAVFGGTAARFYRIP